MVPFSLQRGRGSPNCGTVFLGPWFLALVTLCTARSVSHDSTGSPGKSGCQAEVFPRRKLYVMSASRTRGKSVGCRAGEAVLLCTVSSRKEEGAWFLAWELRCSTEGQKLGAASKINLGVGAGCLLSVSARLGHALVGEHPRRGGAQLWSSILSAQTTRLLYRNCIYILYCGLSNKKKRLLLCFKRVVWVPEKVGSYYFTRWVTGLQFSSRARCLLGGWEAASSQASAALGARVPS